MVLTVLVPTDVGIPVEKSVYALSMLAVFLPLPFIPITVGTYQHAKSMSPRVKPLTNIGLKTLLPLSLAFSETIDEVTSIRLIS